MGGPPELLSAGAFAVHRIRRLIHGGEFDAHGRLSISALAARLGISSTPVREALWQLAKEGLVTISPRVGAFLRRVTPAEAADIYRLKEMVEPVLAEWAAERADIDARAEYLRRVVRLSEVAAGGDVDRYVAELESCRAVLVAMANSPPLSDIIASIDGRVRLLRFRNLSQEGQLLTSAEEHRQVATAIADGEVATARKAMAAHIRRATARITRLVDGPDGASDKAAAVAVRAGARQTGTRPLTGATSGRQSAPSSWADHA